MAKKTGKVAISCAITGAIHTPTMSDAESESEAAARQLAELAGDGDYGPGDGDGDGDGGATCFGIEFDP